MVYSSQLVLRKEVKVMSDKNSLAVRQPLSDRSAIAYGSKLCLLGAREELVGAVKRLRPIYWSWFDKELTIEFEIPPDCESFFNSETRASQPFQWINNIVSGVHFWTVVGVKETRSTKEGLRVIFKIWEWTERFIEEYRRSNKRDTLPPASPLQKNDQRGCDSPLLEYFFRR